MAQINTENNVMVSQILKLANGNYKCSVFPWKAWV